MRQVHFNIDRAVQDIQKNMESVNAEAMRRAESAEDKELVRLQAGLNDCIIGFSRWDMTRCNEAAREDIAAAALGFMVGNVVSSFAANCANPAEAVEDVLDRMLEAIRANLTGEEAGAISSNVVIQSEQVGKA